MPPQFKIIANQTDITLIIQQRLISIRITDESGLKGDTLDIQLDDEPPIEWPRHGAELEVLIGFNKTTHNAGLVRQGLYIVDEIAHSGPPNTFTLRGKASNLKQSLKQPKTRSWDEVTLGDLVNTIAQEHGISAKVGEPLKDQAIPHVDQTDESDLHLLTRLARDVGAMVKPVAGYLVMVPRGEAKSATGQSFPLLTITADQIKQHHVTQTEARQYDAVITYWHDTQTAKREAVQVGEGRVFMSRHTYADETTARSAAKAKLQQFKRSLLQLSLTLIGNPNLMAEGKINVTGLRDPINGSWVIERVVHQINDQGFTSRIDAVPPKD